MVILKRKEYDDILNRLVNLEYELYLLKEAKEQPDPEPIAVKPLIEKEKAPTPQQVLKEWVFGKDA